VTLPLSEVAMTAVVVTSGWWAAQILYFPIIYAHLPEVT
jgi:hypothetical protein